MTNLLAQVESWDEQIFKVVSMTTDPCWSCGGMDDDLKLECGRIQEIDSFHIFLLDWDI